MDIDLDRTDIDTDIHICLKNDLERQSAMHRLASPNISKCKLKFIINKKATDGNKILLIIFIFSKWNFLFRFYLC